MPRPKNTDQRRQQIVEALLKVMAEVGYAQATIQAIAKVAGIRSGLVHYHFESKQEILVELVRQVSALGLARYEQLKSRATNDRERLKAFIDARLAVDETSSADAVAAWVVIGTEAIRQPEVREEYEKSIAMQRAELEMLLHKSLGAKVDSHKIVHLAAITIAAIEGAFQLSVAATKVMPQGYAAEALFNLLSVVTQAEGH